jgi:hypothetical protein
MDMLQLFEYIEDNGLTPNQYYLLWSLYKKRKPKHINNTLERRNLIADELLDSNNAITDKGVQLLSAIEKNVVPGKVVVKTFDPEQYLNLFPNGKLPSGKPAKVTKKAIIDAFTWFFKNFDYSWDIVIKATSAYVDEYETKNYLYMKNSQYFIRKQMSDKSWESDLANYCEMILNGGDTDSHHFSENVI